MDTYEGGSGGRRQKPCRACSDFKSWMQAGPNKSKTIEDSTEESNKNSALEMRLMDHRTSQQTPSTGKGYKMGYSCIRPISHNPRFDIKFIHFKTYFFRATYRKI